MRKIFLILCFCFALIGAKDVDLKQLQKDFDFIRSNIGGDTLLLEAMFYEVGSPKEGIKPDLKRSLELYRKLYIIKNPIAAYKLGMVAWELKQNPKAYGADGGELKEILKRTDGLDPGLYFKMGSTMNFSYRYSAVVLLLKQLYGIYEFFDDKYPQAIEILSSPDISEKSTSQLYVAFSYLKLNEIDMANLYLNKACNNPDKSNEASNFCMNSKALERINLGK